MFTTIWSLQSSANRDNDVYSRQTKGGQSVATCADVIRAVVLAFDLAGIVISNTMYSASNNVMAIQVDIRTYGITELLQVMQACE